MADMIMPQKRGNSKKHTPRVDLTPMVDLGFLLITFFMYTTTMAQPKVMDINMPYPDPLHPTLVTEESTITLIPVKGREVLYYEGLLKDPAQLKKCALRDIRSTLLKKKKQVAALPAGFSANAHKMYVLIKPNDDCRYADVVQLLDEMNILEVANYTLMDITPEEKAMTEKKW